jgi:serine/threonine-protein kinase
VTQQSIERRSYHILGVLGKGGFGKVYKARMEGAAGFSKDVAIKLLTEREPGDDVLQRFRDESRILGLIRDRAIVSVDPPTRLNGRWAVIMECVDGASAHAVLKAGGLFPPRIGLEIVQEVCRALDNVYHLKGPDGHPLELVHRDLKPGNLQLTPGGEVKVLDFGTARARFEAREAETTRSISGTYGYIAPERLQGIDTIAGDVYSMGMVLFRLISGDRPDPNRLTKALEAARGGTDTALLQALELARDMTKPEPEERPTHAQVEERCRKLRRRMEGPELRRWAPERLEEVEQGAADDLVGRRLSETFELRGEPPSASGSRARWLVLASFTGVNLALAVTMVALMVAVAAGAITWTVVKGGARDDRQAAAPELPAPATPDVPAPVDPPPAPASDEEEGADEAAEDTPEPGPAPVRRRRRRAPEPEPPPAVEPLPLTVGSIPMGAPVRVGGVDRGATPVRGLMLPPGTYEVVLELADGPVRRTVELQPGSPDTYIWTGSDWTVKGGS